MNSSINRWTIPSSLASRFILALMAVGIAGSLSIAAEKTEPLRDRFGDPLPPGAIRRFGTLRFRHARIEDIAFTPDGKRLIAGMGSDPLAVFDAMTGRKLRDVGKSSSSGVLSTFTVSPDGKWVAASGEDVFLWEIETGRLVREFHCPRCRSVAFSADGKLLAAASWVGGKPEITLVELATGKHLRKWTFNKGEVLSIDLHPLAFSPEGKYLAGLLCKQREVRPNVYQTVSSQVWLLDTQTGSRVRALGTPEAVIVAFAFQPGTGHLATIEKKGILRFWDVEKGKEIRHFSIALGKWGNKDRPPPGILRFSADGHRCAVADGIAGLLIVLDAQTGREVRRIESDKTATWITADLSPDGRAIAAARTLGLTCVRVWDVDSGVERLADAGHHTAPMLELSADEHTLIGRSEEGEVILWDVRNSQAVQRRDEQPGQGGRMFRPLGTAGEWTLRGPRWRLNYHFTTSTLAVHSLDGDRLLGEAECDAPIHGFAVSPDGMYVASPLRFDRQEKVLLWNPEKEKKPRQLSGSMGDRYWTVLFSHDSKRLITAVAGQNAYPSSTLWVWDVATARPIHKLATKGTPGNLLLSADDRLLISGGLFNDATVNVWDMETGKELASFSLPTYKERGRIGGLALSADERFLAVFFSGENDSTVSVWETGSWKAVRTFAPMPQWNYGISMVFSRDGRSLFVSNSDATILEWEVSGLFGRTTAVPDKDRLSVLWRKLAETPDKAYPAVCEMLEQALLHNLGKR